MTTTRPEPPARRLIIRVEDVYAGTTASPSSNTSISTVRRGEVFGISADRARQEHADEAHDRADSAVAGHVYIGGDDIVDGRRRRAEKILRSFGVMYQSGALFGSMTLLENVRLPLEEYTDLPDEAIDSIARMKLDSSARAFTGHMPAELSGGMQKRAGIARGDGARSVDPLSRRASSGSIRSPRRRSTRRSGASRRTSASRSSSSRTTSAACSSPSDRVILLDRAPRASSPKAIRAAARRTTDPRGARSSSGAKPRRAA
jgi:phospholipid/cholesterol/gamma-HCH transport system ATP-binding protein